jgi:hypothetical protein
VQQRVNDKTARVIQKRHPEPNLQMRKEAEEFDAPTRNYNPLENVTCKIGDNTCAAKHVSAIQQTGILHPMSKSQRVQSLTKLQQQYGNRFVQRVIAQNAIQTKLRIGQPGDIYEKEADRLAEQVTRMPESQLHRQEEEEEEEEEPLQTKPIGEQIIPLAQRQPIEEEEEEVQAKELRGQTFSVTANEKLCRQPIEEEEELQPREIPGQTPQVTPNLEARINAIRGGGQSLPESVRAFFGPRFGHDFSHVRVHADAEANTLSHSLNARAFTTGRDMFFRQGEYDLGNRSGRQLLAHELTHVLQQNSTMRSIHRQEDPMKGEKRFEQVVSDLKPKSSKSNKKKLLEAGSKLLEVAGHKKSQKALARKLRLNKRGRLLLKFGAGVGSAAAQVAQRKMPGSFDVNLWRGMSLSVQTEGTFEKPKVMLGLKVKF